MSKDQPAAIGIDIGGTKIALGRVRGAVVEERETLRVADLGDWNGAIAALAAAVARVRGDQVCAGIGIAAPGPLDCESGTIDSPETLPVLSGRALRPALAAASGLPVRVIHDATAALLAEVEHGAGRGADAVVMLTLGTGVGGGVWQHGAIVQGRDGFAPEIGHIPVGGGPRCYCGADGCLENRVSGSAFDREAQALGLDDSRALFDAWRAGDAAAAAVISDAAAALARGVRVIAHAYAPAVIIIGGGQGSSEFTALTAAIEPELAVCPMAPRPEIRVAAMGNGAGLIGAAGLIANAVAG